MAVAEETRHESCTEIIAAGIAASSAQPLPASAKIVVSGNHATVSHGSETARLLYAQGHWELEPAVQATH